MSVLGPDGNVFPAAVLPSAQPQQQQGQAPPQSNEAKPPTDAGGSLQIAMVGDYDNGILRVDFAQGNELAASFLFEPLNLIQVCIALLSGVHGFVSDLNKRALEGASEDPPGTAAATSPDNASPPETPPPPEAPNAQSNLRLTYGDDLDNQQRGEETDSA